MLLIWKSLFFFIIFCYSNGKNYSWCDCGPFEFRCISESVYVTCNESEYEEGECPKGSRCDPLNAFHCTPCDIVESHQNKKYPLPSCFKRGIFLDPNDLNGYFQCNKGISEPLEWVVCPKDTLFSCNSKRCESPEKKKRQTIRKWKNKILFEPFDSKCDNLNNKSQDTEDEHLNLKCMGIGNFSNENSERTYIECTLDENDNFKASYGKCPMNQFFSLDKRKCIVPSCFQREPFYCRAVGKFKTYGLSPEKYYECIEKGEKLFSKIQSCEFDERFDCLSKKCIKDEIASFKNCKHRISRSLLRNLNMNDIKDYWPILFDQRSEKNFLKQIDDINLNTGDSFDKDWLEAKEEFEKKSKYIWDSIDKSSLQEKLVNNELTFKKYLNDQINSNDNADNDETKEDVDPSSKFNFIQQIQPNDPLITPSSFIYKDEDNSNDIDFPEENTDDALKHIIQFDDDNTDTEGFIFDNKNSNTQNDDNLNDNEMNDFFQKTINANKNNLNHKQNNLLSQNIERKKYSLKKRKNYIFNKNWKNSRNNYVEEEKDNNQNIFKLKEEELEPLFNGYKQVLSLMNPLILEENFEKSSNLQNDDNLIKNNNQFSFLEVNQETSDDNFEVENNNNNNDYVAVVDAESCRGPRCNKDKKDETVFQCSQAGNFSDCACEQAYYVCNPSVDQKSHFIALHTYCPDDQFFCDKIHKCVRPPCKISGEFKCHAVGKFINNEDPNKYYNCSKDKDNKFEMTKVNCPSNTIFDCKIRDCKANNSDSVTKKEGKPENTTSIPKINQKLDNSTVTPKNNETKIENSTISCENREDINKDNNNNTNNQQKLDKISEKCKENEKEIDTKNKTLSSNKNETEIKNSGNKSTNNTDITTPKSIGNQTKENQDINKKSSSKQPSSKKEKEDKSKNSESCKESNDFDLMEEKCQNVSTTHTPSTDKISNSTTTNKNQTVTEKSHPEKKVKTHNHNRRMSSTNKQILKPKKNFYWNHKKRENNKTNLIEPIPQNYSNLLNFNESHEMQPNECFSECNNLMNFNESQEMQPNECFSESEELNELFDQGEPIDFECHKIGIYPDPVSHRGFIRCCPSNDDDESFVAFRLRCSPNQFFNKRIHKCATPPCVLPENGICLAEGNFKDCTDKDKCVLENDDDDSFIIFNECCPSGMHFDCSTRSCTSNSNNNTPSIDKAKNTKLINYENKRNRVIKQTKNADTLNSKETNNKKLELSKEMNNNKNKEEILENIHSQLKNILADSHLFASTENPILPTMSHSDDRWYKYPVGPTWNRRKRKCQNTGDRFPDYANCTVYYVCHGKRDVMGGQFVFELHCPPGMKFDSVYRMCIDSRVARCACIVDYFDVGEMTRDIESRLVEDAEKKNNFPLEDIKSLDRKIRHLQKILSKSNKHKGVS